MSRSLLPSEHGAWAQLGLPLAATFAVAPPRVVGTLLTGAALAAFFAHVPLARLLGRRGVAHGERPWLRLTRDERVRVAGRAALLVAVAGALGVSGLAFGGPEVAVAALVPGVLAAGTLGALALGRERTLAGEVVACHALAGASVPVAVGSGLPMYTALAMWGVWVVALTAGTWAARLVLDHHRQPVPLARRVLPIAATAATGLVLLPIGGLAVLAALPMLLVSLGVCVYPPAPRELRRVGWAMAAAGTTTALGLVVVVRGLVGG